MKIIEVYSQTGQVEHMSEDTTQHVRKFLIKKYEHKESEYLVFFYDLIELERFKHFINFCTKIKSCSYTVGFVEENEWIQTGKMDLIDKAKLTFVFKKIKKVEA